MSESKRGGSRPGAGRKPGPKVLYPCPWQCGAKLKQQELLPHARHCNRKLIVDALAFDAEKIRSTRASISHDQPVQTLESIGNHLPDNS